MAQGKPAELNLIKQIGAHEVGCSCFLRPRKQEQEKLGSQDLARMIQRMLGGGEGRGADRKAGGPSWKKRANSLRPSTNAVEQQRFRKVASLSNLLQ